MPIVRRLGLLPLAFSALLAGGATRIIQDQCGPFTDVDPAFCPFVTELYYLGITAGTSATTFSPDDPLTRGQGAVFIAKGLNQSLARSSRRAALGQWWTSTPHWDLGLGVTTIGTHVQGVASDGQDIWAATGDNNTVVRVRASDGQILGTWTGATLASRVIIAMGRVFVTGETGPGSLYMIDPTQPPGAVTLVASVGDSPNGIAFDGSRFWTANFNQGISIVTPGPTLPWAVTTVTTGFLSPIAALFDGTSVWISDYGAGQLFRLNSNGSIVQTVATGIETFGTVFDGANIWVAVYGENSVKVVRASTGEILATFTGINGPSLMAFDGQRILATNFSGFSVSLWNAADLAPIGTFPLGTPVFPIGACSDGVNFWIGTDEGQLGRF